MTTQTILQINPLHDIVAVWKHIRTDQAKRRRARATYSKVYSELAMLTDRHLADVGIHRSQIHDVAAEAAAMQA